MSAFLGPIHIWLYNKIKFQEDMTNAILQAAEEKGYAEGIREKAKNRYGMLPSGNLEDFIETSNIHGWLQERVSLVENRLAYVVTVLLKDDPDHLNEFLEVVYALGVKHSAGRNLTAREAYDSLENTLLNGMPCDRVNELTEESEQKLVFRQTTEIHADYWNLIQGDVNYYYILRHSLIKGMLSESGLEFTVNGNQVYELRSCS